MPVAVTLPEVAQLAIGDFHGDLSLLAGNRPDARAPRGGHALRITADDAPGLGGVRGDCLAMGCNSVEVHLHLPYWVSRPASDA